MILDLLVENDIWMTRASGRTPMRRLADPEEVARAVLAAGTSLTFTSGAILSVDGGRPLARCDRRPPDLPRKA